MDKCENGCKCGNVPCLCELKTWEYGDEDCWDCPYSDECAGEKPEICPIKKVTDEQ